MKTVTQDLQPPCPPGIQTLEDNGLDFSLVTNKSVTTAIVTGFTGGKETPHLAIPATVTCRGAEYPVTAIGEWAFKGCSGLTSVTLKSAKPPKLGDKAFDGIPATCKFFYPAGTLEACRARSDWATWAPYFS